MSTMDRPLGLGKHYIDVAFLSRDSGYVADVAELLQSRPTDIVMRAVARDPQQLASVLKAQRLHVLLVDGALPGEEQDAGFKLAAAAGLRIILLLPDLSGAPVPEGVEVLFKYAVGSALVESIRSLHMPAQPARRQPAGTAVSPEQPLVLALYSPRGGAGVSTLTANLAYLYAAQGKRVAVVDLARYGSQHVLVRRPQRGQGISSLVTMLSQDGSGGLDRFRNLLNQSLIPVGEGRGAYQLLPAGLPAKMDQVTGEHTRYILEQLLGAGFDMIIADLPGDLPDRARGALSMTTRVLVPVLPEIVSAWHALQGRDALTALLGSRSKIAYVLNRFGPDAAFTVEEFTRLSGGTLAGTIPNDRRAVWADLAAGRLTAARSNAPFTRALREAAHHLYPVFSQKELKRGGWPWSRR